MSAPVVPFVGLRPFDYEDRNVFFGRDREVEALTNLVSSSTMVVVHAPSGLGKSSLLNAGLIPALHDEDTMEVVSCRTWREDPLAIICDRLSMQGRQEGVFRELRARYRESHRTTVVILDQVEELLRVATTAQTTGLWDELAPIANATLGPATIVLSIRDDYLGGLDSLMNRVPGSSATGFGCRLSPPRRLLGP